MEGGNVKKERELKTFTREYLLHQTPSRKDGVDIAKEQQFRRTYCNFIKKLVQVMM
jgi:hypothetical protein